MDKLAQGGMLMGVCSMLQPWWKEGLRFGFFATAIFTFLHIITSHLIPKRQEDGVPPV